MTILLSSALLFNKLTYNLLHNEQINVLFSYTQLWKCPVGQLVNWSSLFEKFNKFYETNIDYETYKTISSLCVYCFEYSGIHNYSYFIQRWQKILNIPQTEKIVSNILLSKNII